MSFPYFAPGLRDRERRAVARVMFNVLVGLRPTPKVPVTIVRWGMVRYQMVLQ